MSAVGRICWLANFVINITFYPSLKVNILKINNDYHFILICYGKWHEHVSNYFFFSILSFNLTSVGKIIVLHGDSNSKIYKIC